MNKKNNNNNQNANIKMISFIPVIIMIAVVPLILRWHIAELDVSVAKFWVSTYETNLYTYAKSIATMLVTLLMCIFSFLTMNKDSIKKDKSTKIIIIISAVFLLFSIMSTVLSTYRDIALWGAPDRREGFVLHLCYILMFLYTYLIFKDNEDFGYIKYPLIFLSGVMFLIGFTQIIGKDILSTSFINSIVIPAEYKGSLTPENTGGMVYLTLMHSNYVGSYASLIIPFFAVLAISNHENKIMRIVYVVIVALTGIILVKANSQAGLVGVGFGILILFVIYFKKIFKSKKLLIGVLLFAVASASIANIVSKGLLLDNTLDIFVDAKSIFAKGSNYVYDPTYGLPVYDVKADGKSAIIETSHGQIKVNYIDGLKLEFTDALGKPIKAIYNAKEMNYRFPAPFENFMLLESSESTSDFSQIAVYYDDFTYYILQYTKDDGAYLIDSQGYRYENVVAPHIGFEGSEKVGSMRGYIWSRTLPLIKEKPLFGYGPDNFLMAFPQYDIAAKTYAYDTPFMIVDKPHNIYLLYAVNSGIIALGAMLVLWGMYMIKSFKMYALKKEYTKGEYYGAACTVSIIGYLAAGFFNDSVPGVAPLFWILLGAGYALNYINKNEKSSAKIQKP